MLTPEQWQRADDGSAATPLCPQCGQHLGIRLGIWRDNWRAAWICAGCGEREIVDEPQGEMT